MNEKEMEFITTLVHRCLNVNVFYFTNLEKFYQKMEDDLFVNREILRRVADFYFSNISYKTICSWISSKSLRYILVNLSSKNETLFIGPYLEDAPDEQLIYHIMEKHHISVDYFTRINRYYQSLPIYDDSHICNVCTDIVHHLLKDDRPITYCQHDFSNSQVSQSEYIQKALEKEVSIEFIAKRYEWETKLMSAISQGNIELSMEAKREFSKYYTTSVRTKDPLRNGKNTLIIFNTILRKSAQLGEVHPVYLDEISSKWAIRIENCNSSAELSNIEHQMLRNYCILVKNNSLVGYSPLVRQAVDYINFNLATNLTVASLAGMLSISSDYLTRLFKSEVHSTVIEFINKKRIHSAVKLLNTTDMSIQNIAMCVGINDISYFGKLFKKQIGMSPRKYREGL